MSLQAQIGILVALGFVVACWALVVGHQLEWGVLADPDGNEALNAVMIGAYLMSALSLVGIGAFVTAYLVVGRRES